VELGFDIGSACSDAALIEIVEASPFLIFLLILNHFEFCQAAKNEKSIFWLLHFTFPNIFFISNIQKMTTTIL